MKNLILFTFENRPIGVETDHAGNPWFNANDVCDALEYANPRDAISRHVDDEDVGKRDTLTEGGHQLQNFVNESGLYSLIFGSTKPQAKRFKKWVTSEVLPAIRKTGVYFHGAASNHHRQRRLAHPSAPDRMVNSLINRRAYELTHQLMPEIRRFLREKLAYEQRLSLENGAADVYSSEWIADALFDCTSEQAITEVYANI